MPAMTDAALDATAEALTRRVLAEVPADRPRGAADLTSLTDGERSELVDLSAAAHAHADA